MKSTQRILFVLMFIGFLLVFSLTFNGLIVIKGSKIKPEDLKYNLKSSANSGKIYINNNWTEAKAAGICTGDGTASSPYLIEHLVIDAGGIGNGIFIENSTDYFKIENCTTSNAGGVSSQGGIKLNNTHNGILVNNTTYDNYQGIIIWLSTNLQIIKNRVYNNTSGIELVYTNESILYLNWMDNDIVNLYFSWSFNEYNSREMFTYMYQGRTYTNFLGNYWPNYDGIDGNNDGIGDTFYRVDSHFHNATLIDNYPLMQPIDHYSSINLADGLIPGLIPGYNILIVIGIISLTIILSLKKSKKIINRSV